MRNLTILAATVALAGASPAVNAASVNEAWRTAGFDLPESVSYDPAANVFYVSNLGTDPMSKDGNGFISRLKEDGTVDNLKWATGLDAPKGTEVVGDRLFVTDIDRLVEIDTATGEVVNSYKAEGAAFLNDLAVAADGRIYIADTVGNAIYLFANGGISEWLKDPALNGPNGLTIVGSDLVVASLGDISEGFDKIKPGGVIKVDLTSKAISAFGDGSSPGNLDGIEPDGTGGVTVTANPQGLLLDLKPGEPATGVATLKSGSADHEFVPALKLFVVPQMSENEVVAYTAAD